MNMSSSSLARALFQIYQNMSKFHQPPLIVKVIVDLFISEIFLDFLVKLQIGMKCSKRCFIMVSQLKGALW